MPSSSQTNDRSQMRSHMLEAFFNQATQSFLECMKKQLELFGTFKYFFQSQS